MNKVELAKKIIIEMGGKENISQSWHCITRLRFNVMDEKKVNIEKIKGMEGVMGAQFQSGQFQVIIGNKVAEVFEAVSNELGQERAINTTGEKKRKNVIDIIFDTISGIFTPILPAIVGAGLLKGVMALLTALKLISESNSEYAVLSMIADAPFYFLPFLVAFSAAKKFKTNEFLAVTIAGVIMYPTIINYAASGEVASLSFLGLSIPMINYSSTVIPIILGVWLLSYIYKVIDKFVPSLFKIIVTPLLVLLITSTLVLIFIAPLGNYVGVYVERFFSGLFNVAGPFAGMLLGGLMPLIVITGMHYAFFPAAFASLGSLGYDIVLLPMNLVSNLAQAGATFAVAIKSKDKKMKSLATSTGISAVFGITEPAIYGVTLKLKKPFYAALIGGAIGGGIFGTFVVKAFSFSLPGITALPSYIQEGTNNFMFALIGITLSFVISFLVTMMFKFENGEKENTLNLENNKNSIDSIEILSPMAGKVVPLSEVPDSTFADGLVGKGVAIIPSIGIMKSPFKGKITTIIPTQHAIGLTSNEGIELLIHIGIDTVNLNGKGFTLKVNVGQEVNIGDELIEFDMNLIEEAGLNLISPIVVTNNDKFPNVNINFSEKIPYYTDFTEKLLTIRK
ncbi:MAG: beta-glucoside-specific PTS transporter subunit IIABC [Clostridium sp.]|uniref:beta-glucoside-specific PTS transporter subunit IIABC n=1 Tax=Clostridium sp. TaxID=1506 RepID=UPI00290C54FF|nr:beta-glucoside-specific PTS transporter subunit IIABC [Clostridium sp.]MDU5108940.1 beta-glucoside-specific PTS transporter subunit IIABC [Clostridium sp.]